MCDLKEVLIAGFMVKGKSEIWAKAYARFYTAGYSDSDSREYADGFEEGYNEVQLEVQLKSIRNLMKNLHLTAETAMNALGISPEKQKELAPLI